MPTQDIADTDVLLQVVTTQTVKGLIVALVCTIVQFDLMDQNCDVLAYLG